MAMIVAAAPQLLDNPCCDVINELPWGFFMLVHIVLFGAAAYFAVRSFGADQRLFGWGFTLFALGEVSYMTYHVNITQFLFAHTISEVLVGAAIVLLFAGSAKTASSTFASPDPVSVSGATTR
jgi:hypothetical protein